MKCMWIKHPQLTLIFHWPLHKIIGAKFFPSEKVTVTVKYESRKD